MHLDDRALLDRHFFQWPEDAVLVSGGNRHVFADLLFNRSTTQATAPCWGILDQPDNERGSSAASYRVPQGGQRPAAGLSVVWYLKLQISIHLEVLAIPGNGREAIFERRGRNQRVERLQPVRARVGLDQVVRTAGDVPIRRDCTISRGAPAGLYA